jgi:hypothetical protein
MQPGKGKDMTLQNDPKYWERILNQQALRAMKAHPEIKTYMAAVERVRQDTPLIWQSYVKTHPQYAERAWE